jgi:hypothetical protein
LLAENLNKDHRDPYSEQEISKQDAKIPPAVVHSPPKGAQKLIARRVQAILAQFGTCGVRIIDVACAVREEFSHVSLKILKKRKKSGWCNSNTFHSSFPISLSLPLSPFYPFPLFLYPFAFYEFNLDTHDRFD